MGVRRVFLVSYVGQQSDQCSEAELCASRIPFKMVEKVYVTYNQVGQAPWKLVLPHVAAATDALGRCISSVKKLQTAYSMTSDPIS